MFRHNAASNSIRVARRLAALCAAIALAVILLPSPAAAQQGVRVAQRNLAELVGRSDTIVLGRVLSVRTEPHPQYQNLQTVVVNLEVIELLKGQSGAPLSFRQYVWDERDIRGKLDYKIGEEVLLLLIKPHPQTGLSSPAGQEQGRFRIRLDEQGNRLVANGFNNAALFRGMDPATNSKLQTLDAQARTTMTQHRSGPLPYDQLKSVIQALTAGSAN